MPKLLVTGASGFLGWNLCRLARSHWQVWGTYCQHSIAIEGVETLLLDLRQRDNILDVFDRIAPDAVIHTAAASSPNFCQLNPDAAAAINVTATQYLATICQLRNIPLVFTSTDLVFDGKNPPYREDDRPCPLNIYGAQKVSAEGELRRLYPQSTICRMPLMFGDAPPTATSFIQPWLKSLGAGEKLTLFIDEFRTPVSAIDAGSGLLMAINYPGDILNLGGRERISRYDFGHLLAEVWGLDRDLIEPIRQADLPMSAPRAADVSLDSSKAINYGYNPATLRDRLIQIATD
jgi:dTDP-4-dehydrorhamnose reductase